MCCYPCGLTIKTVFAAACNFCHTLTVQAEVFCANDYGSEQMAHF